MVIVNSSIVRYPIIKRWINLQYSRPISSILIGPSVKFLLLKYNLDLEIIKNRSGPKNNILKSDVIKYISEKQLNKSSKDDNIKQKQSFSKQIISSQKSKQRFFEIPLSDKQKEFIEKINHSKEIPHSYLSTNVSVSKIKKLCDQLKNVSSINLTTESFIIFACAQALKSVPEINVFWDNNYLQKSTNINISFFSENKIPIIFNFADKIGLEIISKLLKENKDFKNEQKNLMKTFSIFKMLNISKFTSIIKSPQTSILTIGLSNKYLNLTFCFDARAIQQEDACRFLNILNLNLSEPSLNLFLNLNEMTDFGDIFEEENDKNNLKEFVKELNDNELEMLAKLL
ncbi:hypothetical protein ACQ4LE_004408 [Meloidogyne hapla]|uniref:2-oxoacid_dh domain-containing protein n=1 Tax=Meloidogyne hapla TaxID=6305 RepID=A0A1I8B8R2_MELHA